MAEDKFAPDIHESSNDINDMPIVFVGRNVDELNLSKESLREIIDSFHTFKDLTEHVESAEMIEPLEAAEDEFIEEEHLDPTEMLANPLTLKNTKKASKKIKTRFKGKYHKTIELEQLSRQKSLSVSLAAYLDCCVQNHMLNRGYFTMMNYRYKCKRNQTTGIKICDVNLYNTLIQGYAEKENLQKVKELFGIIKEDQIIPNEQTFANILECLGNIDMSKNLHKNHIKSQDELAALITQTVQEATQQFSLNDIVDKSIFTKNRRDVVLHAIHLVEPNFETIFSSPELGYKNHLMNKLNLNVQDITFDPIANIDKHIPGSEIMNSKKGFTREELEQFAREQLSNELNGFVTIKSIQSFPEPSSVVQHYRSTLDALRKSWHDSIVTSYNRDLNTLKYQEQSKGRGNLNLLPYLRALEVDDYANILLQEIRMLAEGSETFSPTVGQLYRSLGRKVQLRYQVEQKKRNGILQKTGEIYGNYCDILTAGNHSDNPRQCWQRLVYQKSNEGPSMNYNENRWPGAALLGVGRFLYSILMRDLKIDCNCLRIGSKKEHLIPAFYTLFRNQGHHVKEEVKPHPILMKLYRGSQLETLTFEVNQVPMMCPPQPWTTSKNGGYIVAKSDLIRLPVSAHQQLECIDNTPLDQLYPSLDSLNQLSSVPWSVNGDILDIILKVFIDGGNDKLDVPQLPSSLAPPQMPDNESDLPKTEKFKLFRQKMMHRRKQAEMYSLWCDALYRLSLANHFRNRVFWLPHNMDFRGRVYPIPPHLNHLGSDLARSLLVFHQKKPLGVDGLTWLKLHCINLTGLKKRDSVRERLLYVEEIMDDILDSADNPHDGRMWWTKSDEPWQTLSCCIEIAKVLRSGDPENYMSSFPIHQDGSCNGLQHYAALGRDSIGAFSVNLSPSSIPQDVYSGVAQLVEQTRQRDEENGIEVAKILRSFVRRKVIKQTVMTTVYGVTRYGARLQIAKQLKDIDDFPKDWVWPASAYLTAKTFDSIREMFTSTREIQDWFTDCAKLISTVCGQNLEWITPLGLPVVQPYNKLDKFKTVGGKNSRLDENFAIDTYMKPNIMKQKNAFPPNFIHSLDSSHMMLTSLYCEKAGLTFISVHDCFWTHACTVPDMNKICREQFVALHNEPILEDLSKYLMEKYSFQQK